MDKTFWHDKWARGETGFHQQDYHPLLRSLFDDLHIPDGATVFVPLCGMTRDMLWLRDQGYRVLGVELSPLAVQAFFSDNGLPFHSGHEGNFDAYQSDGLRLLCGDFFHLTPDQLQSVQAVYDRAALIALPPEMRADYALHLKTSLPPGCPILLIVMDYPQEERAGPPFAVSQAEIESLYGSHYQVELLATIDLLAGGDALAEGLSQLVEKAYLLKPY